MGRIRMEELDLRTRVPQVARDAAKVGLRRLGAVTSDLRPLPDFLILGAQKAGTSALYAYLTEHPEVRRAIVKEVHYFDLSFGRGERWYRAHFPMNTGRPGPDESSMQTGEATPYYLFHPWVPPRVSSTLPAARFIVLLRDPVERLISHYQHEVALGFEDRSLDEALRDEPRMMAAETERLFAHPLAVSYAHQHHSYFSRGRYAEQLEGWFSVIDPSRFLVLGAEAFWARTPVTFERVQRFLGLAPFEKASFQPVNQARRSTSIRPELIQQLREAYEPHNEQLRSLLGEDLGWPRA